MKYYIPHKLLVINEQMHLNEESNTFMKCARIAFDWANQMGLKGKRVYGLWLEEPIPSMLDPKSFAKTLWCQIECTAEERKMWNEDQDLMVNKAVLDSLKE